MSLKKYTVQHSSQETVSLLDFLKQSFPKTPRTWFSEKLQQGRIYVNGSMCKNSKALLNRTSYIDIYSETPPPQFSEKKIEILYQTDDLLVINKPSGVPSQPTQDPNRENIYTSLKKNYSNLALLHRLDRDTSGVLLFGLSPLGNRSLTDQFRDHQIKKTYLAIASGIPAWNQISQSNRLGSLGKIGPNKIEKYGLLEKDGLPALTEFRVVDTLKTSMEPYSLIQAQPKTGRTHQIRVHLSQLGLPIVGDTLYGSPKKHYEHYGRFLLHAQSLTWLDPKTSQPISVHAPLPEDFLSWNFKIWT